MRSNQKGRVYSLERNKKISESKKKHFSESCKCASCCGRRGEYVGKNNGAYGKHWKMPIGSHIGEKNPNYGNGYKILGEKNPNYGNGYKILGEKNPNWKGGKSFEPYPLGWNKTHREQIRYRDGYKCQICGVPEVELRRKLSVHHIDYVKENINEENLVSLCVHCHGKTNSNRKYWISMLKREVPNA